MTPENTAQPAVTAEQVAARIVERIENANYDFPCEADREEAVEIALEEICRLPVPGQGAPVVGAAPDDVRAKASKAVENIAKMRIFVTSKERIKYPEGTEVFDESIESLREYASLLDNLAKAKAALTQPQPASQALVAPNERVAILEEAASKAQEWGFTGRKIAAAIRALASPAQPKTDGGERGCS